MDEKSLLLVCYLTTVLCLLPFRKRFCKRKFVLLALVVPIFVYAFLIVVFVFLALLYGDK